MLIVLFCAQCAKKEETIINPQDYAAYLVEPSGQSLSACNTEIAFWRAKLQEVPESGTYRVKIASLLAARFMLNGRIEDVKSSDSLYHLVIDNDGHNAGLRRALAANYITQHRFREAKEEVTQALAIGEGKAASLYMLVDVNIELGDYAGARVAMNEFANKDFFPYVIRQAKLKDHEGQLDSAIVLMEGVIGQVRHNPSLLQWTQSNLADMYGHAGRIEEAYHMYLEVLRQNPDYDYALKGIAWIAFSNDHNTAEAKRIVNVISSKRATPDMHLLLAEIAAAEGDTLENEKQLTTFARAAAAPAYGDMYNKYLALLEAEAFDHAERTIAIAQREVDNRPTPQSYDLLAWGYLHHGDEEMALMIAREFIEDKTYEPEAIYHLARIYEANGQADEAQRYFEAAAQGSFELGPAVTAEINRHMN